MVLTDRQRADLHAGIHEYLLSQPGEAFAAAAQSMFNADPEACGRNSLLNVDDKTNNSSDDDKLHQRVPLLEKKWTAVPRLQKRVLELERAVASASTSAPITGRSAERRNLPRPPALRCMAGHTGPINSVSLHPTYSLVASGSDDATVKLWDFESGEFLRTLKGHVDTVTHVSFDRCSGRLLASASADLTMKLWEWKEGANIADWVCIKTLRGHDHTVSAVAFVPAWRNATTVSKDVTNSTDSVTHVLSASRDATIRLWEIATGFCVCSYNHGDWVRCLAITTVSTDLYFSTASKSGTILASGANDAAIKLWTIEFEEADRKNCSKHLLTEIRGHGHVIECLSFVLSSSTQRTASSKNKVGHDLNTLLVSGSRDKTVKVWNFVLQECLFTFESHDNWVKSVILHPSGNFVISSGDDRSIRVWDLKVRNLSALSIL